MLLTLTTSHTPATDLGFLLHKHPERIHRADLPFGCAHVVYPEAGEARCTAALLVEVDPVGLVRGRKGPKGNDFSLGQYVNDRPYAASSFLSVAIGKMFGTALSGRSKERPELPGLGDRRPPPAPRHHGAPAATAGRTCPGCPHLPGPVASSGSTRPPSWRGAT